MAKGIKTEKSAQRAELNCVCGRGVLYRKDSWDIGKSKQKFRIKLYIDCNTARDGNTPATLLDISLF